MKRKRSGHFRRQSSTFSAVSPTAGRSQENDKLAAAFDKELQCMERIGSLLGNIPEGMCYLSKDYATIADTGNYQCWRGSSFGT